MKSKTTTISRVLDISPRVKKLRGQGIVTFIPYSWLLIFFLVPCLILLKISFSESVIALPPYISPFNIIGKVVQIRLNLENYIILLTESLYVRGFLESIFISAVSTFLCILVGYPMAYAIARSSSSVRPILQMLVVLPFWTSFLIRVYAWVSLLNPSGLINSFLIKYGLISNPLPLMNNRYAVILGIVYAYLPFMVLPLCASISKIEFSLLEAAYDLGCSPLKTFFSITLPLSFSGMLAGSILVFIPATGEYVIPELLGGSDTLTIGRIVWNEFFGNLSWPVASALSIVLVLFVVLPVSFWQKWQNAQEYERGEKN